MKKILFIILGAIIFFHPAQSQAAYIAAAINAASAIKNLAAKTITVPALLQGTTAAGASGSSWTGLTFNAARLATIGGAVLAAGAVGYGVNSYIDYFINNSTVTYDEETNGFIYHAENPIFPEGFQKNTGAILLGYYADTYAASDAINAQKASECPSCQATPGHGSQYVNGSTYKYYYIDLYYNNVHHYYYAIYSGTPVYETIEQPATAANIESQISTGLAAGTDKEYELMLDILKNVEAALANSQVALARSATWADVKAAIDGAIDSTAETAVETAIDASSNPAADAVKNAAIPLSAGSSQLAIEEALKAQGLTKTDIVGDANFTDLEAEETPAAPDKLSLTAILDDWWSGFMQLPIVSLLDGLTVTASGSSSVSFPIPGFLGGSGSTATVDFADYASVWALMGQILLTVTGIRWTIYLFE